MPTTNPKPIKYPEKDITPDVQTQIRQEAQPPAPEADFETKTPEYQKKIDQMPVKEEGKFLEEAIESLKGTLRRTKRKPAQIPQVRDEITIQVEKIMEEGLVDAFREMTPVQQQEFKIKGEKTALEIRSVLRAGKVKMKKIFNLLIEWLKLLPGINRFFLEQEAKIKADKIISLKKMNNDLNY